MKIVADVGNPDYYITRSIEELSQATTKLPAENIKRAIGLLALALVKSTP